LHVLRIYWFSALAPPSPLLELSQGIRTRM
jgi:hypothetical protein